PPPGRPPSASSGLSFACPVIGASTPSTFPSVASRTSSRSVSSLSPAARPGPQLLPGRVSGHRHPSAMLLRTSQASVPDEPNLGVRRGFRATAARGPGRRAHPHGARRPLYRGGMATTSAALLRGINVGGGRKVPMAELRTLLEGLGHTGVRTYLQSGQAVFASAHGDEESLAAELARAVEKHFGFAVDVIVRDHAYLRAIADACPFPAAELEGRQLH